jgi:hypothetical protein
MRRDPGPVIGTGPKSFDRHRYDRTGRHRPVRAFG